jgi:hypothetical protein
MEGRAGKLKERGIGVVPSCLYSHNVPAGCWDEACDDHPSQSEYILVCTCTCA